MGVYVCQNLSNCTLRIRALYLNNVVCFKKTKWTNKIRQHSATLPPSCPLTPYHWVRCSFLAFPVALHAGPIAILITVDSIHLIIKLNMKLTMFYHFSSKNGNFTRLNRNACSAAIPACELSKVPGVSGPMMFAGGNVLPLWKSFSLQLLPLCWVITGSWEEGSRALPSRPHPFYPFKVTRTPFSVKHPFCIIVKLPIWKWSFKATETPP